MSSELTETNDSDDEQSNKSFGNVEKGKLLEKAISFALWNNRIMHNHNDWDSNNYVWGDGADHYLIESKHTIEAKNLSYKSIQNLSKAWLQEEVLDRGNVDVVIFSYQLRKDLEQFLYDNGVSYIVYVGFQVYPYNFDQAVINLSIQYNRIFLHNNVGVWYSSSDIDSKIVNNREIDKETNVNTESDTTSNIILVPKILFLDIISSSNKDSINNYKNVF